MAKEKSDDGICRMTDHPNIYNCALTVLKSKGFKLMIWPNPSEENPANCTYWAKKGGRNFDAQDPLRLLGMISIWEEYGDDWYHNPKVKTEKIRQLLDDRAYPDDVSDFEKLSDEEFRSFVSDYKEFFSIHIFPDIEIPENVSREKMYDIVTTYYTQ
ncbi:MAG: hypothetical protein K0S32_2142 [Bacteroidetes bacterium]|jgi:hypothetical protein|nr:hypothetical protein [Bacteroidota bacterium]